jgi:hypothetical protein
MEPWTGEDENSTVSSSTTTDDAVLSARAMSVSALISETAVRNVYISIGSVGFVANLLVIIILVFYTNMTEKVS